MNDSNILLILLLLFTMVMKQKFMKKDDFNIVIAI